MYFSKSRFGVWMLGMITRYDRCQTPLKYNLQFQYWRWPLHFIRLHDYSNAALTICGCQTEVLMPSSKCVCAKFSWITYNKMKVAVNFKNDPSEILVKIILVRYWISRCICWWKHDWKQRNLLANNPILCLFSWSEL